MLKCWFSYEKYSGHFEVVMKKLAFVLLFFTRGGWIRPCVEKDLLVFPIVMGMDPESFVCYSLVLSYFLIRFSPDQTQYCPTDALNVFSFKTLRVLFVWILGRIMAGRESIGILKGEGVEGLKGPFLILSKLWLLLATMCINENILLAVCWERNWGHSSARAEVWVMSLAQPFFQWKLHLCGSLLWEGKGCRKTCRNSRKTDLSQ